MGLGASKRRGGEEDQRFFGDLKRLLSANLWGKTHNLQKVNQEVEIMRLGW